MKNLFLALAICFSSVQVFGGNDGPSAAPREMPRQTVLARVASYDGMAQNGQLVIEILNNGQVKLVRGQLGGEVRISLLATLSQSVLRSLKDSLKNVSDVTLVDNNPNGPMCEDAPVTSYQALKNGKLVKLKILEGCHTLSILDPSYADHKVIQTLEALELLARYN